MDRLCAYWAGGTSTPLVLRIAFGFCICIPPPKNPPFKNLRLLNFANLTLHAREARGVPQNQWFSLLAAKENHPESNLVFTLVTLYNHARTYFTNP